MKIFAIGAARNTGYYAASSLLQQGHSVTFFLRNTDIFDSDENIVPFVTSGKAQLIKGDMLVPADIETAWATANEGGIVDLILFCPGKLNFHPRSCSILISVFDRRSSSPRPEQRLLHFGPSGPLHSRSHELTFCHAPRRPTAEAHRHHRPRHHPIGSEATASPRETRAQALQETLQRQARYGADIGLLRWLVGVGRATPPGGYSGTWMGG